MTSTITENTLPTGRVSALHWQTARRKISLYRPLVMAILNVTPDSFSDGGAFISPDDAIKRAEEMIADGADIIDVGGESTRPGSERIAPAIEGHRVLPVVTAITKRFNTPISIDTTNWRTAKICIDNGAEIINDISGLRWDARLADVAARSGAGLVLMHSRGTFETMHSEPPVTDVFNEVKAGLVGSIEIAKKWGVAPSQIAIDIGIGFGKTFEQNLELLAKLGNIVSEFGDYPLLVGASRKSFIGRLLGGAPPDERMSGSIASVAIAVFNGARIVRVHDVKESVDAIKIADAIRQER